MEMPADNATDYQWRKWRKWIKEQEENISLEEC